MNGPTRRLAAVTVSACVVSFLLAGTATAAMVGGGQIPLQMATADASQFFVADLLVDNNAGWGGDAVHTQRTAVFETTADESSDGFKFTLLNASPHASHNLGKFRILATTAPRTEFADGLNVGGDIGFTDLGDTGSWTELIPTYAASTGGGGTTFAALTINPDNSVLASGANPAFDTYVVRAARPAGFTGDVTGFRFEALPDAALPHGGPGRFPGNGNFVTSFFSAETDATNVLAPLTGATATFVRAPASGYQPAQAIDGNVVFQGYALNGTGETASQQALVVQTASPLSAEDLQFVLIQTGGGRHTINEFRISATTVPNPDVSTPEAAWTALSPESLNGGGLLLADVGDNHVRSSGIAATSTYTMTAGTALTGITGFRLEMFPANNGRVGAATNGNFILSEFIVNTGGRNLALGAPVTSTGSIYNPASYPASNLTDGNPATLAHGNLGTTHNFQIDLGSPVAINQINIFGRDACCPDRLSNYRVSVHQDNGGAIGEEVWSAELHTDGSNPGFGGMDTLRASMDEAGAFRGQWINLEKIDDGTSNYWLQVAEVEVIGDYLTDYAPGAPVTASADAYGTAQALENVTDGNLNTFSHLVAGSGPGSWYAIDLGQDVIINNIDIFNRNDGSAPDRLKDYIISVHADDNGSIGQELWSAPGGNSVSGGKDTLVASMDPNGSFAGRWVKVTAGPTAVEYSPQFAEIRVFGVPEPGSLVLLVLGALGLAACGAKRRG